MGFLLNNMGLFKHWMIAEQSGMIVEQSGLFKYGIIVEQCGIIQMWNYY